MFKRLFRLATGRSSAAADANAEIASHLELAVEDLVRRGYSVEEARAEALRRFGDAARIRAAVEQAAKEQERRTGWREWLYGVRSDATVMVRGLRRTSGFTIGAVATLAVAIGLTTAVFSVFRGVLLRPLPYHDPGALVRIWSSRPANGLEFFSVSAPDFNDWRTAARSFSALATFERQRDVTIRTDAEPARVAAARVSADLFRLLGVSASFGRFLEPADDRPGAPERVVVLSYGFWLRWLGGTPGAVGTPLSIDGEPYTIVGVMPRDFVLPGNSAELWTPLGLGAGSDRGNRYLRVLGRLRPGITVSAARTELLDLAGRLEADFPGTNAGWSISLRLLTDAVVGESFRLVLTILLAGAALVLVVACANVALMLLGRNSGRARELGLRIALGAGPGRLVRLLAVEGLTLALIGGGIGLALGCGLVKLVLALGADTLPRLDQVEVDPVVFLVTLGTTVGCGVLFGVAPGRRIVTASLAETLREGALTVTAGRRRGRVRAALVMIQVGLALMLLAGAGVLVRSLRKLEAIDLGFEPSRVLTARLALPSTTYADRSRAIGFYERLLARLREQTGIRVALASTVPLTGPNTSNVLAVVGRPLSHSDAAPDMDYRVISPDYFTAMGIPLIAGRAFTAADDSNSARVAVIDEPTARRFWPAGGAVGARIRVGDVISGPVVEIVGVVGRHRYWTLEGSEPRPLLYFPLRQSDIRDLAVVIQARGAPETWSGTIRSVVRGLDPGLPVGALETMTGIVDRSLSERRFNVLVAGVLALVTLVLAVSGLYGIMAATVAEETRELGIRMALGADRLRLVNAVLGRSLALAAAGVGAGLVGVFLLNRTLASLLYQVAPTDGMTLIAVSLLLAGAALAGAAVPAWRAAQLDPLVVLRQE
jgi:predicted permease